MRDAARFVLFKYETTSLSKRCTIKSEHAVSVKKFDKSLKKMEFEKLLNNIKAGIIQVINLTEREINDDHFIKIIQAISSQSIHNILQFQFSGNRISSNAIKDIAPLLKNLNIKKINLSFNDIDDEGAQFFVENLSVNYFIEELNLFGNNISPQIITKIDMLIKRNVEIRQEIEKKEYYIAIALLSNAAQFPPGIRDILFDYYNDSAQQVVRNYIDRYIKEKWLNELNKFKSMISAEIFEKMLFEPKCSQEVLFGQRLESIEEQFDKIRPEIHCVSKSSTLLYLETPNSATIRPKINNKFSESRCIIL